LGTLGGSNRLMTLREVADVLGFAEQTVYNQWRSWGLPFYRPGGSGKASLRIRERDLWAWLETKEAA
jgi:excisionase family DNA binding protein